LQRLAHQPVESVTLYKQSYFKHSLHKSQADFLYVDNASVMG
jgi:hypothetical protein